MSDPLNPISFEEALKSSSEDRVLLIGNGFSIGWDSNIFTYKSLKENSSSMDTVTSEVFKRLDTVDFEEVINAFESAHVICECAGIDNDFAKKAISLKKLLIDTIASSHPNTPDDITNNQFESSVSFLSNFNKVFTLNYDMLLYWILIRDMFRENGDKPKLKKFTDGFAYKDNDFLHWDGHSFKVHYLHGALHLFEETETTKLNYKNSLISLKSQFIELIQNQSKFPLFVAEGDSKKKLARIRNSGYLTKCFNSLGKIGKKKTITSLFTYGFSYSKNDQHILDAISTNNCQKLFIGIYGNPQNDENKNIKIAVEVLKENRKERKLTTPLEVTYYKSASAKIWGNNP